MVYKKNKECGDPMKKSRQLAGLQVLHKGDEKPIGRVCDIVFYPGEKRILGFCVNCGSWFKNMKVLLSEDIDVLDDDMLIVKDGRNPIPIESSQNIKEALMKKSALPNARVVNSKGEELGFFDDVIIDEVNMTVQGYVITDGIIEDIKNGKTVIPDGAKVEFGDDYVLLDEDSNITLKNDISLKKVFDKNRE